MAIHGRWCLAFTIARPAIPAQFIVGLFADLFLIPGLAVQARRTGQRRRATFAIAMCISNNKRAIFVMQSPELSTHVHRQIYLTPDRKLADLPIKAW